jgi:small nuclear ribonucleoprotein (snRNP)-like protein
MNIVLDDAVEEKQGGEKVAIGMVVSAAELGTPILYPLVIHPFALRATNQLLFAHLQVIRGNSVVMLEVCPAQHQFFILQTSSALVLEHIANFTIF